MKPSFIADSTGCRPPSAKFQRRFVMSVPGARFVSLDSRGHLMIGQQKKQREALARFFAETPTHGVERVAS
jgi:hypothetical protein